MERSIHRPGRHTTPGSIWLRVASLFLFLLAVAPSALSGPPIAAEGLTQPTEQSGRGGDGELHQLLGERAVVDPELNEGARTWVDRSGKFATVAVLLGVENGKARLESAADGKIREVPLSRLTPADAAYARLTVEPRVDPTRKVLLGEVVSIVDGDTIKIRTIDEKTKTVRLDGIDAPEKSQAFSDKAKTQLGDLVFGKDVRVEVAELDRYGRHLGTVYADNRDVNLRLVRDGLAWHYKQYSDDEMLAAAEALARAERLNLWSDARRVAPWDWRKGERPDQRVATGATATAKTVPSRNGSAAVVPADSAEDSSATSEETVYVTRTGSKYHRAGCRHLSKSSTAISLSRAISSYEPCKNCHP